MWPVPINQLVCNVLDYLKCCGVGQSGLCIHGAEYILLVACCGAAGNILCGIAQPNPFVGLVAMWGSVEANHEYFNYGTHKVIKTWETILGEGEVRDDVQFVVGTLQGAREAIQSALAVAFEEGFRNIS